jgi:hypothetical protein
MRRDVPGVPFLIVVEIIMNSYTNTLHLKFYRESMMENKPFLKNQPKEINLWFN